MSEPVHEYKAGSLIVFSQGAYSDYGHLGHFVVLRDIAPSDMQEAAEKAMDAAGDRFEPEAMIAEMIRQGFLLSLDCREIYLGEYSEVPDDLRKPAS